MIPWASPSTQPKWHHQFTIGSAVFAQITAGCPYTLQWAVPSASKLAIPILIWTPI